MEKHDLKLLVIGLICMGAAIKFLPQVTMQPSDKLGTDPEQAALEPVMPSAPPLQSQAPATTAPDDAGNGMQLAEVPDPLTVEGEPRTAENPATPDPELAARAATTAEPGNSDPVEMPATLASVQELLRKRDYRSAATLLSDPALQDDPDAKYLLSNLYRKGQGVPRDLPRAFSLVQAAAEAGHLEAQFSLGRMYLSGKGTEKNTVLAQLWMARAAESGHVGATEALVTLITQLSAPAEQTAQQQPEVEIVASAFGQRTGLSPLLEAAARGETRVLDTLIAEGAEIDARDADGRTPLILAASEGHVEALGKLLSAGARFDATDSEKMTALMHAAENGHIEVMVALFAAGAGTSEVDGQGHSVTDVALLAGQCASAAFAFENMTDVPPAPSPQVLAAAIAGCDEHDFVALAEHGVPLDFTDGRGRNGLWHAAQHGKPAIAHFYVEHGADPNGSDVAGLSPLLVAINGASEDIAEELIANGAEIDSTTSSGNTPLMIAATRGLPKTALALIEHGADVNHRNRDGFTALMLAAKYGRLDMAETLIANGADTDLRNVKRERAAEIAVAAGYDKIALLMD